MVRAGRWLLGLLVVLPGCAVHRAAGGVDALTTTLPADVLAFLCADACRLGLPGADPVPYAAGAPATDLGGGAWEVRYQQRPDGRWSPQAAGRLQATAAPALVAGLEVAYRPTAGLDGCRLVDGELVLAVAPLPTGAQVRIGTRGDVPPTIVPHLQALVRFCEQLGGEQVPDPCCAHHARLQAIACVRAAERHGRSGNPLAARDALRSARAAQPDLPGLDYRIGLLDRRLGHDELAVPSLLAASRATADPALRAAAADQALASSSRLYGQSGELLRQDAIQQLACGDLDAADALAQQARAVDPDPIADLRLRHRLLRARDDTVGALAASLLLREYGGGPQVEHLLAQDLEHAGHEQLARRQAARALVQELRLDQAGLARPAQ